MSSTRFMLGTVSFIASLLGAVETASPVPCTSANTMPTENNTSSTPEATSRIRSYRGPRDEPRTRRRSRARAASRPGVREDARLPRERVDVLSWRVHDP